jgi:hypothetical protein
MAKNNGFPKELPDQLLAGRGPKTVLDSSGLIGDLKKALAERMLNAEMDAVPLRCACVCLRAGTYPNAQ